MRDYRKYRYSIKELFIYFGEAVILSAVLGYLFYDTFIAAFAGIIVFPFLLKVKSKSLLVKQKQEITSQFGEMISSVATALGAGYSVENSFREAYAEISELYGKDSYMARELSFMVSRMSTNVTLDELLADFALRCDIDDVTSFTQVFLFAKRGGGDFINIIKNTTTRIQRNAELQRTLEADLASRRLESRLMNVVPMFILLYLKLTSPGYFDCLYANTTGILIMSVCLVAYGAAYMLSEKMISKTLEG